MHLTKSFVYKTETFFEKSFNDYNNVVVSGTSQFKNFFKSGTNYDVFMYLNCFVSFLKPLKVLK